jgi:hypothetical protein
MLVLMPFGLRPALATDLTQTRSVARVAALENAHEYSTPHAGLPIRKVEVKADLMLLLAQREASMLDGAASNDTILVSFALSEPYSLDEDIAAQHDLKLVDGGSKVGAIKGTKPTNRSLTYERQRQRLLGQLAVAEEARRLAMEKLEELERSHTHEGMEFSESTPAAPAASLWPKDDASETRSSRRANLRRRCIEIRGDPDGYEKALMDLCQTM